MRSSRNQPSKAVSGWNNAEDDMTGSSSRRGGGRQREPSIDLDEPIEDTKPQRRTKEREFNNTEQEIGKLIIFQHYHIYFKI
jgi:hypothetical protein